MRFRILTLLMIACFTLLLLKVADIVDRRQTFSEAFFAPTLNAQEEGFVDEENQEDASSGEGNGLNARNASIEGDFSDTELNILQNLVQRRKRLEEWEEEIRLKKQVLDITQTQIDQKLEQLRTLKGELSTLLAEYNEKEELKIRSLVKIYEAMKPKDAAAILEELPTDTLLRVVGKMSERRVAPILAFMDPKRAREITTEYADRRRLPDAPVGQN